jgi:rubrerythrin
MSIDNKEQQVDQLLRGVYRMCVNRDDCKDCPFYISKCSFGEPKPSTWFDEETIEIQAETVAIEPADKEVAAEQPKEAAVVEQLKESDNSDGTWIVSTTMGGVFTKYVFICSKCGYKKESVFSMTPLSYCPECEKRKANPA